MHRRKFITRTSGLMLAAAAPVRALAAQDDETSKVMLPNMSCRETRRQTPGPYPALSTPLRSDVREGLEGTALRLKLRIHDSISCQPASGAVVDIWQSDAEGRYSGVENIRFDEVTLQPAGVFADLRGQMFLRGHQVSDETGAVEFTSIFPGWYFGRLPHIHVRVIMGDIEWTRHDTQLYLPTDVEREVYAHAPYAARGQNPLPPERDLVTKGDTAMIEELTLPIVRDGDGLKGVYDLFV